MYYDRDIAFSMHTPHVYFGGIQKSGAHRKCNISVIVHWKKKSFEGYPSLVFLYQQAKYGL